MSRIRNIEVETCCICGEEFDKIRMHDFGIGRTVKWMCPKCYACGNREVDAKNATWKNSVRGKQVIKESEKNK